jgi:hypothetical protein
MFTPVFLCVSQTVLCTSQNTSKLLSFSNLGSCGIQIWKMSQPRALLRVLLAAFAIATMTNFACGESINLESLGFSSKEADLLKTLGVQGMEDLEFLRQEDLSSAAQFSVVEMRRLQYKVGKINAIGRIKRMDSEGIVQEMKQYRLDKEVQTEGGKALARRIQQAMKSSTKLEKIGRDDGATDALTRAIDIHDEDGEVVANAVNGMSMLAMTEESKITIGAEGGLDAVLVALKTHRDNVKVMLPAMKLLARISINDKIKKIIATEEIMTVILSSIPTHRNESEFTDMACLALWHMTSASPTPTSRRDEFARSSPLACLHLNLHICSCVKLC